MMQDLKNSRGWTTHFIKKPKVPIPAAYKDEAVEFTYSSQNGATCSKYTAWSAEIAQVLVS